MVQIQQKSNIFIIISLVSTKNIDVPVAHFVRAQCSVLGVSGSNPAKFNFFIIIALVSAMNIETPVAHLLERSVLF